MDTGILIALAALVVTTLGLGVALWQVYLARRRPALTYAWNSVRIAKSTEFPVGKLMLLLDDRPIDDAWIVRVHIRNSGSLAVTPADFASPLKLLAGDSVELLAGGSDAGAGTVPFSMSRVSPTQLEIDPFLMNPKEYGLVTLLTTGKPRIAVTGRVRETAIQEFVVGPMLSIPTFVYKKIPWFMAAMLGVGAYLGWVADTAFRTRDTFAWVISVVVAIESAVAMRAVFSTYGRRFGDTL